MGFFLFPVPWLLSAQILRSIRVQFIVLPLRNSESDPRGNYMKLSNVTLGLENKFFPEVLHSEDHLLYFKQEMKVDPFSGNLKHFDIRLSILFLLL